MRFRSPFGTIPAAPCGQALPWTLAILMVAGVAQLALFVALQGREPAAQREGTRKELVLGLTNVLNPNALPQVASKRPSLAPETRLPAELPPVGEIPANLPPSAAGKQSPTPLVATPKPPAIPPPPSPVGPTEPPPPPGDIEQPDPSVLPQEDVRLLVAEAVVLRRSGDMAGAIGKLNGALDLAPGHPRLLFEMAATYEAMGMTERAVEAYRNVASMGPTRAGALHPIAERRLKEGLRGPGSASADDDALYLGVAEEIPRPDEHGQTLLLRFDIHARPGVGINASQVSLPVRFFDLVDGKRTEPSIADAPEVKWVSPPVDWKEPGVETVEVTYHLADEARGTDGTARKYFGYRIELYYQDTLLDILARPRRLASFQDPLPPSTPGLLPEAIDTLPDTLPESLGGTLLGP